MKKIYKKNRTTIYIAIIIMISILSLFSIIEYKWFNNIYKEEFNKTYNTLLLNTNRVVNRELERIEIYANWIKNSNKNDIESLEYNLSQTILDDTNIMLDKDTIISIGYINLSTNEEKLFDRNSWSSTPVNNVTKELILDSTSSAYTRNNEDLTVFIKLDDNIYIEVNIDLLMFSQIYVIPSLEESNFDLEISNFTQSNDENINTSKYNEFLIYKDSKFSPIKAIFEQTNITAKITLPVIFQDLNIEKFEEKEINKPASFADLPNFKGENTFSINQSNIYSFVTIEVETSDFYGFYIEKTLSFIFIGGLFLIGLIGFICILLIYQMNRIQKQHQKEREFTASITHELRTPLTVIQSASDNLRSNLVKPERIPAYGTLINQQSNRLNTMIENLLVFSKIENNKAYQINETEVILNDFLNEIEKHFVSISKEKNIIIKWTKLNINKEVLLDRSIYELILSNLVNNSIFHAYNNNSGEIRISIQYSDQKKSLIATIEDDGRGIPTKEQKYIYNSYYRGEKSITTQERGSGLGLFIVKKNVSMLGGKIKLESPYRRLDGQLKNGCKFEFIVPCKEIK